VRTGVSFRDHSRRSASRAALTVFAAVLVSVSLAACGSSSANPSSTTPPNNLISQAELKKGPATGVEHAFLEFWSDLQFRSWAEVASFYLPAFRESVGTAAVIGGEKINASSYPQLKPEVESISGRSGLTTIKYTLQFIEGDRELASITWQKHGGNWEIVYDSRLDAELSQFAEDRVELARTGALPTEASQISPEAARAGSVAAQSQARFLQQNPSITSP
jgi:hypothetical protein